MNDALQGSIPVFKLYGEKQHWPTPDLLHCELIRERSGPHNWHIPPHRHADLLHMLYIRRGHGIMHLEGGRHPLEGPNLLVVPSMAIHGFDFEQEIDGYAITLAKPLVSYLSERLEQQGDVLSKAAHYPLTDHREAQAIDMLVAQLHAEYLRHDNGRDPMLHALMQALTVQIARRAERRRALQTPRKDKGHVHLVHFQQLVDSYFKEQPSIASLAGKLGITGTHLNTLCQRLTANSALQLLHERVMLEAKRQLTYTNMTISQIADDLGFSEPAYFTRFFKRHTGHSPKAFRQRQG